MVSESPELVSLFLGVVQALADIEFHFDPLLLKRELMRKLSEDRLWFISYQDINEHWTNTRWQSALKSLCKSKANIKASCGLPTQIQRLSFYFDAPKFKAEKINGNGESRQYICI